MRCPRKFGGELISPVASSLNKGFMYVRVEPSGLVGLAGGVLQGWQPVASQQYARQCILPGVLWFGILIVVSRYDWVSQPYNKRREVGSNGHAVSALTSGITKTSGEPKSSMAMVLCTTSPMHSGCLYKKLTMSLCDNTCCKHSRPHHMLKRKHI
eukprot:9479383-Pyramimonas_sp.AAC.1